MLGKYVIYSCIKDSLDVEFSLPYNSFNAAKDNIENFLTNFANKRGKKIQIVSKEEFEKIKLLKKPDNCLYVRRKNSEAVVYSVNISEGRIYNSYTIEKYAKIGINEFLFQEKLEAIENIEQIKDMHITNYERGAHVSFVNDLKNVLAKREKSEKKAPFEKKVTFEKDNKFALSLIDGKTKLKKVL